MRKGFNFLLSYHRVYEKLQTDQQRADFVNAIMQVQFLKVKIEDISFEDLLLDMAFESVKHSLEASVEGYLNKVKEGDYKGVYAEDYTPTDTPKQAPSQQEKEEEKEEGKEEGIPLYVQVIADLNRLLGSKYSHKTATTQAAINARAKEGYTLRDFQYVHRVKYEEWHGTDQEKWLRPATLYRPANFENYLQQKPKHQIRGNPEEGSLAWYAAQRAAENTDVIDAEVDG